MDCNDYTKPTWRPEIVSSTTKFIVHSTHPLMASPGYERERATVKEAITFAEQLHREGWSSRVEMERQQTTVYVVFSRYSKPTEFNKHGA